MKDKDLRDKMVKRVQATHKKYPHFQDLPAAAGGDFSVEVGASRADYVNALYSVCYEGEVVGRNGSKIVGKYL